MSKMKIKTLAIIVAICFLLVFGLWVFLTFAFFFQTINPAKWSMDARYFFCMLAGFIGPVASVAIFKIMDDE